MFKKTALILLAALLAAGTMSACTSDSADTSGSSSTASVSDGAVQISGQTSVTLSDQFSDSDLKDVTTQTPNAEITLSGNEGTISDTTRGSSGSDVTITSKGIYKISGSSEDVTIRINDSKESGNVYLILDGVSMTNAKAPCIVVEKADKVILQCVGENTLIYQNSGSPKEDGAVYAKDDLTINGSGKLKVQSQLHGIVCKNDLKLTGSQLTVQAEKVGLRAGDSCMIGGGSAVIHAAHDGIKVSNKENSAVFLCEAGKVTVETDYDGIAVAADDSSQTFTGKMTITGGELTITSGGGSDQSKNSDTSQKGLKCHGDIQISGGTVTVSSADDALNSKGNISIQAGQLNLSSSDDGITAAGTLQIRDGSVTVSKAYEGLEAYSFDMSGGKVSVTASDDGINTAGGSDTTSSGDDTQWTEGDTAAAMTVSGGELYVNASGDGLDSNGSIYITGGTVIIEGPQTDNNGAIDVGDNGSVASVTGGTVLALGSTGMAVNFNAGTQCAALVNLSGTAGTEITADDGSGFRYTATKDFSCVVYSSPELTQGKTYTLTAGENSAALDLTSDQYYSDVVR